MEDGRSADSPGYSLASHVGGGEKWVFLACTYKSIDN